MKKGQKAKNKVIKAKKRVLKIEYQNILASIANFTLKYKNQCYWKEIKMLDIQIIAIKKMLKSKYLDILTSIVNLILRY